jgi:hypothetical protein
MNIEELKKLLSEATPGPWRVYDNKDLADFCAIAALRNQADELIAAAEERDTLRAEVARLQSLDASLPRQNCSSCAKELEFVKAEAEKHANEARRWRDAWQTVSDERAKSFAALARAVGGVGMTEYQPEVDMEIEARILAIKAEVERLRIALREIAGLAGITYLTPERAWPKATNIAQEALNLAKP